VLSVAVRFFWETQVCADIKKDRCPKAPILAYKPRP
jgi:hypothetical protein